MTIITNQKKDKDYNKSRIDGFTLSRKEKNSQWKSIIMI